MKFIFTISLASLLFFNGCDQESNITSPLHLEDEGTKIEIVPEIPDSVEVIPWPYPPGADTIFTTVGIPESEIPNLEGSMIIDGQVGGKLDIDHEFVNGEGNVIRIIAVLNIPSGAFNGRREISMKIDNIISTITFHPKLVFNIPLEFNIKYRGIDLSGIDPNTIDFIYQHHDGSIEQVDYDEIAINFSEGLLELKKADLYHFSRYGFVN